MNTLRHVLAVGAALFVAGSTADAQLRRSTATVYPDPQTMPTGTCRVWIEGLPASRQPAPTDCATARRNQPRNSRIIYGSRPTNVYGNRDPRSIPGSPQYDPRYDPRNSQYDPRLDPHDRGRYDRYDRKLEKEREKAAREREREARKREKEREKAWKKAQRDRDDDHRYGNRGRSGGSYGTYGTVQQGCADVNRDGICDNRQSSTQVTPTVIPQPVPRGTTQRVCDDVNRDGRCDDGGPLIRRTP